MSDERERFPAETDETEDPDVEAHRNAASRNDVSMNDEGEQGDEPDVEAHRWANRNDTGV